jgi:hypothetical protein
MVSKVMLAIALTFICAVANAQNFITYQRSDPARSQQIVDRAEECRRLIALAWFGQEIPQWSQPCVMTWRLDGSGGGGATQYASVRGTEPSGMKMEISGRWDRLINDVIPHEVFHLVFASKLGSHPARWMDEGGASTTETDETITRMEDAFLRNAQNGRTFPANQIMMMREYPPNMLDFYYQSVSMSRFLIGKRGPQAFFALAVRQKQTNSWTQSFNEIYGYSSLAEFQTDWMGWVSNGSPAFARDADLLANMKPIPRGQAPFRPMDQLQADHQLASNCPPQQSSPAQQPIVPQPSSTPPQQQVKIEIDYEKLANELAKIPDVRGPSGRDGSNGINGTDGKDGEPCEITAELVSFIAEEAAKRIKPCECIGETNPPTTQPQPVAGEKGDCACTDEQLDEIARRAAAILKGSTAPSDADARVLYFTSDSCTQCDAPNKRVAELKSRGAPITVIKLSERDAETRGVPMIFIPKTERRIVGLSNVNAYLATVLY